LGSIISKDNGGTDRDVAERIKKARGAFRKLNTVWRSTTYSNNTKIRILNTNVMSDLLYGCETWKLTKTIIHQLQVLINRCIRRILKIFWPVQISNQELWARAKQRPNELEIWQRKWEWLGHTLRQPPGDIAKAALEWNPQKTRPQTTWRRTILEEIRRQGKTWKEVKVLARNRVRWRKFGPYVPLRNDGKLYLYMSSIQDIKHKLFLLNLHHSFLIRGNQLVMEKYTSYLTQRTLKYKEQKLYKNFHE
jgi:hypothetical protein